MKKMPDRYWPLGKGRIVTSPFGNRPGGFHTGVDFGRAGGSAGMAVYAVQGGIVIHAGPAQGYGGPDPAGWLVIDSDDAEGSGVVEYGHIIREVKAGDRVLAGQRIGRINPDSRTNGGVAPHLHLSYMPREYNPNAKRDPLPVLKGAREPEASVTTPAPTARPDFNEYVLRNADGTERWSPNNSGRNGTKIDLFLLHTQEGNGNADSLARWMEGNGVSYHYTVSMDARDRGVTVVDVVDTDLASWSCLNANSRSINLCFAGSFVSWSRQQWMANDRAIDVAAYLAVQDCRKYGIPLTVIAPPYSVGRAGISDHNYVTRVLKDGTHTDVGPNFPWDYFAQRVAFWANPAPVPPPVPAPQPVPPPVPVPHHPATVTVDAARWQAIREHAQALTELLK